MALHEDEDEELTTRYKGITIWTVQLDDGTWGSTFRWPGGIVMRMSVATYETSIEGARYSIDRLLTKRRDGLPVLGH